MPNFIIGWMRVNTEFSLNIKSNRECVETRFIIGKHVDVISKT